MKRSIIVKSVLVIILGLTAICYLFFLPGSIYEAVVFPQTPRKVTLAQGVEMDLLNKPDFLVFDKVLYVSITDAIWECASVKQSGYRTIFSDKRRTNAVFIDAEMTAVVFVEVDGFLSCQELKEYELLGELQRVYTRPVEYQSDTTGTTVIDGDTDVIVYNFCTHCTPSNASFIPVCAVFFPIFVWGYYKYGRRVSKIDDSVKLETSIP